MKIFLLLAVLGLAGCSTGAVVESNVKGSPLPHAVVGFEHWIVAADGKTHVGAEFSSEGHDTYNWEMGQYGQDLKPPRAKDFGVTKNGDNYDLTEEAVDDWGVMATWSRSAEHSKKTMLQKVTGL
jgi:hypothetical protein